MRRPANRTIGRGAAAAVGAALLVALTALPAAAVAPTITSFNPTTGAPGTSVIISGSDFTGATSVTFNGVAAPSGFTVTASQITATVPCAATTCKIAVTTPGGTGTSATDFTVTAPAAPTIGSFTPTTGPVGTSVAITGTNLCNTSSVKFSGTTATSMTVNSPTQVTAAVPTGAATGPIQITTPAGSVTSSSSFTVTTTGGTTHSRSLSIKLKGSLNVSGVLSTSDAFEGCTADQNVKIQRKQSGSWKTLKTVVTNTDGSYQGKVNAKAGTYRTLAPKSTSGADTCAKTTSSAKKYSG